MVSESAEPPVKIICKPIESENPLIIEGFPGIGLVGNITCQYIIEELKMKYIGSIDSKYFPPLAVLFNGIITMPVRIYESEKHGIVVVISDIPIHPTASYDISKVLVDWMQSVHARNIISIAGIATTTGERRVFGGATNAEMLDKIKDITEIFQVGTISGISGSIMTECFIRSIPAMSLLGETPGPNPDPRAAVQVINVLNNLFGLSIETQKLISQAEQIELELSKLAEQVKTTEVPPIPKKEFPMYG
ncbi:TIGR00161 family protein [Candidatus Methanoperedens nitroreducens]|uniref:TIGR00161 family protein n=1 Tax=Candidatus Methanoperedens nitratireducens TaxID=1392998 RepID=A0A062V8I5_9EURY|nr:proteasome assembly chaperone family protein [Candidatus Methanoperedens nitroreducens]KCZ72069.1 TIGR00161 family protein [Candidatus Methanoperedens nitroreducens]MDJ1421956.1 proteasome assembly chaperone family protein [Candidatus Methanoperedens sp.]